MVEVQTRWSPAEVDYVVVGGGSAGCVLTARLSEDPDVTVAVLEAGGPADDPRIPVPAHAMDLPASALAWPAHTTAQGAAGGRVVPLVTGTGLGGGSSINAAGWFQGQPADYDRWAAETGEPAWSWPQMQHLFRRIEDHELGASEFHGAGGPITVSSPAHVHPLSLAFVQAGQALGWPSSLDLNGAQRTGVGLSPTNMRNGRRHSVVDGYLAPAAGRDNLFVQTGAFVESIVVENGRAVGVRVTVTEPSATGPVVTGHKAGDRGRAGSSLTVAARRGVVLAAGAVHTPQLLMLSGIGPAEHLREVGVDVAVDLAGVGNNLHDHPAVPVPFRLSAPATGAFYDYPQAAYDLLRRGPLAAFPQAVALLAAGNDQQHLPFPELVLGFALLGAQAGLPAAEGPDGMCQVGLLDPRSRGTVRLASADPRDAPLVDPRYLHDSHDRQRMRSGVRTVIELFTTDPLNTQTELLQDPPPTTDEDLDALIDQSLGTYYHPVGTARMGTDADTVVDARLGVHGVDHLWVADASVMPHITHGLVQAPVIAIAERAAAWISRH